MQLCNRIYYSKVFWSLNMFRAARRSSSGALNCICSLWFIYPYGDRPLSRLSGISVCVSDPHRFQPCMFYSEILYTNLLATYVTLSLQLTILESVCTVMCSWRWAEELPETCRAFVEINLKKKSCILLAVTCNCNESKDFPKIVVLYVNMAVKPQHNGLSINVSYKNVPYWLD
jgi:hypothetical protein